MFRAAAVLVLFVCAACGSSSAAATQSPAAQASAAEPDAATLAYRNLIDGDFRAVNRAFDRPPCPSREVCLEEVAATRSATETLLSDLDRSPAPPALTALAANVRATATAFVAQLDSAAAKIAVPSSNYTAVMNTLSFHDLDLAVATMDCWPKPPVNPGNEGDYSCA